MFDVADGLEAQIAERWRSCLTAETEEQGRMALADTVACSFASAPSRHAVEVARNGRLWLWGSCHFARSVSDATYVNAYSSHAADWDSVQYLTYGHPAVVILPSLIARMERGDLGAC